MPYKVKRVVEADDVPTWERRPPKWDELVEQVLSLEPNTSLEIEFDNIQEANRARNAVRDGANLRAREVILTTRLVEHDTDGATLFLTRLFSKQEREALKREE